MSEILKILFTGDFAPCRAFEAVVLDKKDQVLGDACPLIKNADVSFTNLECPLTRCDKPINKSGPVLKADPKTIDAIKDITLVGLANNHILDYGKQGLEDTLKTCHEKGLKTVGAGLNINQAQQVFIQEFKGVKVAIIAIAEHEFNQSENGGAGSAPIEPIDNYQQIKQAQSQADIVIVTLHGGNEYFPYPRPGLRRVCQHFIDLNVDAVICHHPHVPGAYEYHQGKPIIYSLGNFIFDASKLPKDWELGYMAQLNYDIETKQLRSLDLIPYKQSVKLGGLKLLQDKEKYDFLARIETYRQKVEKNHQAWLQEWKDFVAEQADSCILRQFFPFTIRGLGLLARNTPIAKIFFNRKNSLSKLNMVRCQSHLELLISTLESKGQPRND